MAQIGKMQQNGGPTLNGESTIHWLEKKKNLSLDVSLTEMVQLDLKRSESNVSTMMYLYPVYI